VILIGGTIWVGNWRWPVQAHRPLEIRGTSTPTAHATTEQGRPPRGESESTPCVLRVATYNIRGGRGRDNVRDLDRIADTLAGCDFVGLQEVQGRPVWGGVDQPELLGERLGMQSAFAAVERRWGRDSFGNGLLSRTKIVSVIRIPLPSHTQRKFRNAILAVIQPHCESAADNGSRSATEPPAPTLRVLVTHLDTRNDREIQLQAAWQLFRSLEQPALWMGDFNTPGDDAGFQEMMKTPGITAVIGESWTDREPLRGVDWIVSRGLPLLRSESRDQGGSDHAAVYAEFDWSAATERARPR